MSGISMSDVDFNTKQYINILLRLLSSVVAVLKLKWTINSRPQRSE